MKVLGVKQFHQMRFKFLDLSKSKFEGLLGRVPKNFILVVKGYSGNGKTEFCVQLAKELCKYGTVAWVSYEQRHGADLQEATKRNNIEEVTGRFFPIDPISGVEAGVSLLEDLDKYLDKRNSPDFIFLDSVDYTGFTWEDYVFLRNKYGRKKAFIFIAHSTKSGILKKRISEQIAFDGGMIFWVSNYIAIPEKNRFGGMEDYMVWEQRARELNPLYFAKRVKTKTPSETSGLNGKNSSEKAEKMTKNTHEEGGVRAKKHTKTDE